MSHTIQRIETKDGAGEAHITPNRRATRQRRLNARADTEAYLDFLARQPEVSSMRVGTTGHCMGGGLSLSAAGKHRFPDEQKSRLIDAFQKAGVDHKVETYEGAHHGWVPPDSAVYNASAAERHWSTLLALFEATLKA